MAEPRLSLMTREHKGHQLQHNENFKRRRLLIFLFSVGLSPTLPSFGKTKVKSPFDEKRIVEQNKRIQRENNAPDDFPSFIREGFYYNDNLDTFLTCICNITIFFFSSLVYSLVTIVHTQTDICVWGLLSGFEVKVVAPDNYVKSESGLIFKDFEVGMGDHPKDGQQVFPFISKSCDYISQMRNILLN